MSKHHGYIDVKKLIEQLDDALLLEAADAYFSGLSVDSEQCYKPFSNVADAIHITRNVSLLLQATDVFRGADVLDFGCATGWLSLVLANLGCSVVGVDISPSALRLANAWCERAGVRAGGAVRFQAYDGHKLPMEDNSVDRVVCFDAFHHAKDQGAALLELARVVRPGGRVAMVEPGPRHSQTAKSQAEMARYKVIENDIDMAAIASAAAKAGLTSPQMLVQFHTPTIVPYHQYLQWSRGSKLSQEDCDHLLNNVHRHLTDTQCFFMCKPGIGSGLDSRRPDALAAEVQLVSSRAINEDPGMFELQFRLRNTGAAVWICQRGALGQVNLGCQLLRPDNTIENLDFKRYALRDANVEPGEVVNLTVRLALTAGGDNRYGFDMVAENVAWFAQMGRCAPAVWKPEQV